jgi:DNA-binding protein YbaB
MDDAWAMLEELVKDVDQQTEQARALHQKMHDITGSAQSPDGLVTVTVGAQGDVRDLRFDPRTYRKLSPSELSETIVELISAATEKASTEVAELIRPLVGDLPFETVFGPGVGVPDFLPRAARPGPEDPGVR